MRRRVQGVTRAYVEELAAAGYTHPTIEQLLTLREQDVTIAFIRQARADGRKPSIEGLLELRSQQRK